MKKIILVTALFLTATIAQADVAKPPTTPADASQPAPPLKEQHQAESAEMREKIKAACASDITATGCTSEFGHGLMKCIHAYKETNKDYKVSDTCKAAAHEGRHMKHERREARKAMRGNKGAAPTAPTTPETK
jgi:hypothetical protein